MSISIFETRKMMEAYEFMPKPRTFLRDTFFKNVRTFDTESIDIDIYKGKRKVAVYVSPNAESNVVSREGYTTDSYKAPYIKEKTVTTAEDVLKRSKGENIYSAKSPEDRASDILAEDMMMLDSRVTRAEEVQASQALFTGELILLDGKKLTFPMESTHKITLSGNDLWSDTTNSDPIVKMEAWRRLLHKDSGISPDTVIMSPEAWNAFRRHTKVEKEMNLLKVDNGQINPQLLPNGVTYYGFIPSLGCDIWGYDEYYLGADGTTEYTMVPAKKVFMGSTRARMDRNYGLIKDLKALYATERFFKSWEEEDPSARFVGCQAAPLLVPVDVNSFLFAQVLS